MTQSVSRWPLTAQALVRFQDRRYEVCGVEAALGEVSFTLWRSFLVSIGHRCSTLIHQSTTDTV